jgi:hypothetical protein
MQIVMGNYKKTDMKLRHLLILVFFQPILLFGQISETFSRNNGSMSETFCFQKSGTYIFISGDDWVTVTDDGTYKMNGDTITLNSYVQLDDFLQIKKWKINKADSVFISISLFSGQQPVLTTLIINDTVKYNLTDKDRNGILKFKNGFVKSIKVESFFLPWQLGEKSISIGDNNVIEILLDDTKGYRRAFFKQDKFLFKKTYMHSVTDKDYTFTVQPNMKCSE